MHDKTTTTTCVYMNNFYQHEFLPELGKEGHFVVKGGFVGRSFGVFTSGGDAQGIKSSMIHLLKPMLLCLPLLTVIQLDKYERTI